MTRQRADTGTIEIESSDGNDYADLRLPDAIARQAQILTGSDEAPQTLGEQAQAFGQTEAFQAEAAGDVEQMLIADDSRHQVHLPDRSVNTYCFLDALALGLLADGPVEVTTRPPGSDEAIELTVSSQGIQGGDREMVVSFGFSAGMPTDPAEIEDEAAEETLATMHEHGCPTMNLFRGEQAYEAWTSEADAVTMPLRLHHALALVRDYVQGWRLDGDPDQAPVDIRPSEGESYAGRELPEEIRERLRVLTGLAGVERAPRTLGDFAELNGNAEAFLPDELGVEAMLLADESRHEVRWGDRTAHTNCILDALILGFVADEPVEITTRPPGSDEPIELTVSRRGIQGGNEEMVVSFGFSTQLPSDPSTFEQMEREEVLALAHEHGCPKINLFVDEQAYEAWASEADPVTMPMSLPEALALSRDTARAWER